MPESSSQVEIAGLHHVTAITGDASANVDFYTRVLGMRLVKRTVNQDDVSAYHLFYGDRLGSPGSDLTFFDWPHAGKTKPGPGTIGPIGLRVGDPEALTRWARRFDEMGVAHSAAETVDGRTLLSFSDPEGQRFEMVVDGGQGPPSEQWTESPVPEPMRLRGFHDVTVVSARPAQTIALLSGVLGFRPADVSGPAGTTVMETGQGGPGTQVRVVAPPGEGFGRAGIGGVHHVAFRTPDEEEQVVWQQLLSRAGVAVTPVIDRYYFRSIYFREPGGALFEIATDGPGFTADEPADALGGRLSLPPFLEPQRESIEAGLRPL